MVLVAQLALLAISSLMALVAETCSVQAEVAALLLLLWLAAPLASVVQEAVVEAAVGVAVP